MSNADVLREACRVIWSEGDISRVDEFYAEDFRADYPMTDWGEGAKGVKALAGELRAAFPDYCEAIEELYEAGEYIIVKLTIRGTHLGAMAGLEATGRRVEFRDVTICRVSGGKILEQSGLSDYLSLYQQLGVIEVPG